MIGVLEKDEQSSFFIVCYFEYRLVTLSLMNSKKPSAGTNKNAVKMKNVCQPYPSAAKPENEPKMRREKAARALNIAYCVAE